MLVLARYCRTGFSAKGNCSADVQDSAKTELLTSGGCIEELDVG
jgi:hypothetical protein